MGSSSSSENSEELQINVNKKTEELIQDVLTKLQESNDSTKHMPYVYLNKDGDTELHTAMENGHYDIALAIVQKSPNPALLDIRNKAGLAPIHLAVLKSQPRIILQLRLAGANMNVQDEHGNTPLHLICKHGDKECLNALMEDNITE